MMTTTLTRIEKALTLFEEESSRDQFVERLKTCFTSDEVLQILEAQIKDCGIDAHEIMTFLLKSELKEDLIEWINDVGQFSWKPEEFNE